MAPKRARETTYEVVDHQAVIVDAARAELITLNPVATAVWERLDGVRDAEAIAAELEGLFEGVTLDVLHGDVQRFIDELSDGGLVHP